jgi:DNA adenine methylase
MKPFLRWPGGKRWLEDELITFARSLGDVPVAYCEPFLGGGSLLIAMLDHGLIAKNNCFLGDLAPEAFFVWKAVLENPVRTAMEANRRLNDALGGTTDLFLQSVAEIGYYRMRDDWNERAPRNLDLSGKDLCAVGGLLIALNRLSFKGLLRVNPHGNFNVSYGHLPTPSVDMANIVAVGQAMQKIGAVLAPGGWSEVFEVADGTAGVVPKVDVVDPPYAGTTHTAYTQRGWTDLDRKALALACRNRNMRGWSTFATDAKLPDAWDAWQWGNPVESTRSGGMSDGNGSGRDQRGEILVRARHVS